MTEQIDGQEQERKQLIQQYFVQRSDLTHLNFLSETLTNLTGDVRRAGNVFYSNLVAAYLVASSIPVFARQAAQRAVHLMMLGVATGVYGGVGEGDVADRREQIEKSLRADISTSPWKERADELARQTTDHNLADFLEQQPAKNAAMHILRQCAVLTWSAFEVLASDLFLSLLNTSPKLSGLLLKDERTKNLYQSKELVLALEDYEYDLSRSMGEVLLRQHRMDDLETMRATYDVLFKTREGLRDSLNDDRLWRLGKIRNLVVHRAAVVDDLFLKSTGVKAVLGSKLKIEPQELEDFILVVARTGVELLAAAATIGTSAHGSQNPSPAKG